MNYNNYQYLPEQNNVFHKIHQLTSRQETNIIHNNINNNNNNKNHHHHHHNKNNNINNNNDIIINNNNINNNKYAPLRRSHTAFVNLVEQHRKIDRNISEPTSRYKTELCRPFEENGSCKYGDKCQFAHGYDELRNLARHPKYKTELCRTFHKIGFCPYGPRCHFVHNFDEARNYDFEISSSSVSRNFISALYFHNSTFNLLEKNITTVRLQNTPEVSKIPILHINSNELQYKSSSQHHSLSELNNLKSLNLSPTFSLGSAADSPSSSLSQSPTNSMGSFFNDELIPQTSCASLTLGIRKEFHPISNQNSVSHSQSPQVSSFIEYQEPRTPSPSTTNFDARLPVFNKISEAVIEIDNLKI